MKISTRFIRWAGFALFGFVLVAPCKVRAASPTLSVGASTGSAGSTVTLPITFTAGSTDVAAVEFTLSMPAGWTVASAAAGPAATSAGKSVTLNSATNIGLVYGMNAQKLSSGVIANVVVKIPSGASAGANVIAIKKESYSDPRGKNVKGKSPKSGSVTIG